MNFKKLLSVLFVIVVIAMGYMGTTAAYIVTNSETATNVFEFASVTCDISEEFDGTVKDNVKVRNTGNVDAFIRCNIVITFKDANGDVSWQKPVENQDYNIVLNTSEGWSLHPDGYYYWDSPVKPNDYTGVLISHINETDSPTIPAGYSLSVEILADAIQTQPENVAHDVWGVNVSGGKVTE